MRIISELGEMQQAQDKVGKKLNGEPHGKKEPIVGHAALRPTAVPGLYLLKLIQNLICREKGHAKNIAQV
ncbi:MAG: hypothetical protein M0Z81_06760 [Deltaproteobacteria bacterium]|jgi:hypothetical protein|nr:hypothetical protein [Deltaproteobacteria bacterium]